MIILTSENYISTKQASEKYSYSLKALRYLIKTKKVKAFKHSNKWYIYEPSLEAFSLQ